MPRKYYINVVGVGRLVIGGFLMHRKGKIAEMIKAIALFFENEVVNLHGLCSIFLFSSQGELVNAEAKLTAKKSNIQQDNHDCAREHNRPACAFHIGG